MEGVFSSNSDLFLNELSIPASGNELSVQLKQYSFIQIFFFCSWKSGALIFGKNNLIPANGNSYSGYWKAFFSSILRHSCYYQLYFSVQQKRIFKRIPVSENRFCGQWKPLFNYFQAFLPVVVFFSSSGNVFLKLLLYSGQWKLIFWLVETILFQFLIKAFSIQFKLIFPRILHFGQRKLIFWLVETILIQFLIKAFSVQCKLIFQQTLHCGQWKLIFWLVETILFQFLVKAFYVQYKLIFQQTLHSCQWKLIFSLVETILLHFSIKAFPPSVNLILNKLFILASGN